MEITKTQAIKVGKTAAYVGVSAILAFLISYVTDNPESFGIYAPIINVLLVTLKQLFTSSEK
jgi:hypothetical protein